MPRNLGNLAPSSGPSPRPRSPLPPRPAGVHSLHGGEVFGARECVCLHGRKSPAFQGRYARANLSLVIAGSFHASSSLGEALLGAGAMLMGNPGDEYEYRHVDDGGDRSIVFDFDEATIEQVERSVGGRSRAGRAFERACLPASSGTAAASALAREALGGDPEALREAGLSALGAALGARAGGELSARPTAWQERKVAQLMRHVEANFAGDCSLDALASHAGISSFHFLRVFRALTGQTPRQFVIATRLGAAAAALAATGAPVIEVAAGSGFGDLSNFNASFVRAFGATPRAYRRAHARA